MPRGRKTAPKRSPVADNLANIALNESVRTTPAGSARRRHVQTMLQPSQLHVGLQTERQGPFMRQNYSQTPMHLQQHYAPITEPISEGDSSGSNGPPRARLFDHSNLYRCMFEDEIVKIFVEADAQERSRAMEMVFGPPWPVFNFDFSDLETGVVHIESSQPQVPQAEDGQNDEDAMEIVYDAPFSVAEATASSLSPELAEPQMTREAESQHNALQRGFTPPSAMAEAMENSPSNRINLVRSQLFMDSPELEEPQTTLKISFTPPSSVAEATMDLELYMPSSVAVSLPEMPRDAENQIDAMEIVFSPPTALDEATDNSPSAEINNSMAKSPPKMPRNAKNQIDAMEIVFSPPTALDEATDNSPSPQIINERSHLVTAGVPIKPLELEQPQEPREAENPNISMEIVLRPLTSDGSASEYASPVSNGLNEEGEPGLFESPRRSAPDPSVFLLFKPLLEKQMINNWLGRKFFDCMIGVIDFIKYIQSNFDEIGFEQYVLEGVVLYCIEAPVLNIGLCGFAWHHHGPIDVLFYKLLGIQKYLRDNGRNDDIFYDEVYYPLNQMFKSIAQMSGPPLGLTTGSVSFYMTTTVTEDILWQSRHLGSHTPFALLTSMIYFNTKYFHIATVEDHKRLNFEMVRNFWCRYSNNPYPPMDDEQVVSQRKDVQHLYAIYETQCPESVLTGRGYYFTPIMNLAPFSEVKFTNQPLNEDVIERILYRVNKVQEIMFSNLIPAVQS